MNMIYEYIDSLFIENEFNKIIVNFKNDLDSNELNIIKSLIYNDESYLNYIDNFIESFDYKIITSSSCETMLDDGGSNYNIYYKFNIQNNKIAKYEDHFVEMVGYEYKDKVLYIKNIDSNTSLELKNIIEEIIINNDLNDTDYCPYMIEYKDEEKDIYNSVSIKSLIDILNTIDNYE